MKQKDLPHENSVRFIAEEHAVLVAEASLGIWNINEDDSKPWRGTCGTAELCAPS
jgi:hypothetical protein